MRRLTMLTVALVASLLACGGPQDAADLTSPLDAQANNGLGTAGAQSGASAGIVGTVNARTGDCPAVTFTLEAKTITTNVATHYEGGACADLKNGARVKVSGATQANGSIVAQSVGFGVATPVAPKPPTEPTPPAPPTEPKPPTAPNPPIATAKGTVSEIAGSCPEISFKLDGKKITTTATTRYERGACADLKNGVQISAAGTALADGSIVAQSIGIGSPTPVPPVDPKPPTAPTPPVDPKPPTNPTPGAPPTTSSVTVKGTASEVAGSCPVISLNLEGKKITTTTATRYEGGLCADVKNGALIAATGTLQADGSIQAVVISVSK